MFKRNGFLFVEVLMGLFLLSIIVVTCLPILSTALENMRLAKIKAEMVFIAESTMEKILSYKTEFLYDDYIFDIKMSELIDLFQENESVSVELPLHNHDNWKYCLRVCKNNINDKLWNIHIEISSIEEEKEIKNVILQSIIPIES